MEENKDKKESCLISEVKDLQNKIMSFDFYSKVLRKLGKCICKIIIGNTFGTGFLMKLQKGNSPFYCLLTFAHAITEYLANNNIEIEIRYNYISENKNIIKIKLYEKERFIRNYSYLGIDASAIEIFKDKEISKEFFYDNDNYNINILMKNNYELLRNINIHVFQFPGHEDELNYSSGNFLEIFKIFQFYHEASTLPGSSGSPIFCFINDSITIFGIHKGGTKIKNIIGTELKNYDDEKNAKIGDFIYPLIDSLRKNADYDESGIFKGEIIENLNSSVQKGELLLYNKEKNIFDKIYIGELLKYRPNGKGILYKCENNKKKNIIYFGDFIEGKYQGKGTLFYDNKGIKYYKGDFFDNKRDGVGKYYENNKLIYEGEFKDDKYQGKGKILYKNDENYEGEFINGKNIENGMMVINECNIFDEEDF